MGAVLCLNRESSGGGADPLRARFAGIQDPVAEADPLLSRPLRRIGRAAEAGISYAEVSGSRLVVDATLSRLEGVRRTMKATEKIRLEEAREQKAPWRKWGPYVSASGEPCARTTASRATRGTSSPTTMPARAPTARARTASPAFPMRISASASHWLSRTARIQFSRKRLFGLANSEGNHGEDVKEYCFYLDSTPTHSYMKYLYKYPQAADPYADLVEANRRRSRNGFEYELLETGVFDHNRYFDVFVEYAKDGPEVHPGADHGSQPGTGRTKSLSLCGRPAARLTPRRPMVKTLV
jgi:hypothetical protein